MKGWVLFGRKLVALLVHAGHTGRLGRGTESCALLMLPHELGTASPLLFCFREAAAGPASVYREKTGFNLSVLGKEDADGVKGAFATR